MLRVSLVVHLAGSAAVPGRGLSPEPPAGAARRRLASRILGVVAGVLGGAPVQAGRTLLAELPSVNALVVAASAREEALYSMPRLYRVECACRETREFSRYPRLDIRIILTKSKCP